MFYTIILWQKAMSWVSHWQLTSSGITRGFLQEFNWYNSIIIKFLCTSVIHSSFVRILTQKLINQRFFLDLRFYTFKFSLVWRKNPCFTSHKGFVKLLCTIKLSHMKKFRHAKAKWFTSIIQLINSRARRRPTLQDSFSMLSLIKQCGLMHIWYSIWSLEIGPQPLTGGNVCTRSVKHDIFLMYCNYWNTCVIECTLFLRENV